ncbi:MAG: hypothetical protein E6G94_01410 [Alphaproteobacteria bacterium]|nr:MAG: hypothetical protein E6G94_01410 [Alphaproteobacteria bacterium]
MKHEPAFTVREGSSSVLAYKYGKPPYGTDKKADRSARYCLAWYRFQGDTLQRETKTGERAARDRAREIAIDLANDRSQTTTLSGGDREIYLRSTKLLEPFRIPLHAAVEEWAAARSILGDVSIIEAANIVVRSARTSRAIPSSKDILEEMLAELADHHRSDRHIDALRADLEPYVAAHPRIETARAPEIIVYLRAVTANVGPRRRDNIRDAIVQHSRFARKRGYLAEDRQSEAEKVGKIKAGHDVKTWTPGEAALLLEHVSPHWLPWMALGLFAGMRTSEILRIHWSSVKFGQGVIAVSRKVARKIRVSRLVPISPNLTAWLLPYRDRVGQIYPGNFKTNENLKGDEMARLFKITGLDRRDNANRHSYGSYRLAVVKNFEQVSVEMGNSPRKVREDYNDPKPEAEGLEYFKLMPPADSSNVVPMPLPLEFR